MRDYLLLTLAAPMASFGMLAVGERRSTDNRPTRSQIIGLTAAALGIPRADEPRQKALTAALGMAVRVEDAGTLALDYHTAQAAGDVAIRKRAKTHGSLATRRDELACYTKTILSMREYRTGVLATVVLWLRDGPLPPPATLTEMAESFRRPGFTLCAGRKSFTLMLPCRPLVVASACIEDALEIYDQRPNPRDLLTHLGFKLRGQPWLYADADCLDEQHLRARSGRIDTRRDQPESRTKWRFGLRSEFVVALPSSEGTT
jgi:CRISPR system Cascade subunit CasD